jgi:hypothetical protein
MKTTKAEKDEMRAEYKREDFGRMVRGKHAAQYAKGTNLVLLDDKVAKAFPTAKAVNDALLGLLTLAKTASSGARPAKSTRKRAA